MASGTSTASEDLDQTKADLYSPLESAERFHTRGFLAQLNRIINRYKWAVEQRRHFLRLDFSRPESPLLIDRVRYRLSHPWQPSIQRRRPIQKPAKLRVTTRLLHLAPGTGSDPLKCSLSQVVLYDQPKYEALSYTWGDPADVCEITCSNKNVSVTRNLHAALSHLRYSDRSRVLWVDALCINQHDLRELAEQVSIMGKIFTSAERVLIWLGEELEKDRGVLRFIDQFWHKMEADIRRTTNVFFRGRQPDTWSILGEVGFDKSMHRKLGYMIGREWFQRAWVFQEAALPMKGTVICGHETVEWFAFLHTFDVLWNWSSIEAIEMFDPPNRLRTMGALTLLKNVIAYQRGCLREPWMLVCCASFLHSTDPRDKIFGVLGLIPEVNDLVIRPSYSRTYQEIYRDFAKHELTQSHRLHLLACSSYTPVVDGALTDGAQYGTSRMTAEDICALRDSQTDHLSLPSWVPVWTRRMDHLPYEFFRKIHEVTPQKQGFPVSCASGHLGSNISFSSDSEVLLVAGLLADTIAASATRYKYASTNLTYYWGEVKEILADHLEWLEECHSIAFPGTREPTVEIRESLAYLSFWQIVHGDAISDVELVRKDENHEFRKYLHYHQKLKDLVQLLFDKNRVESDIHVYNTEQFIEVYHLTQGLVGTTESISRNRRFCRTTHGRLGWLSADAGLQGDVIGVLYGAPVPLLLRPDGIGRYRLHGECIIRGIMQGEALQLGLETQMFPIC